LMIDVDCTPKVPFFSRESPGFLQTKSYGCNLSLHRSF
jgi:hypothetical protein